MRELEDNVSKLRQENEFLRERLREFGFTDDTFSNRDPYSSPFTLSYPAIPSSFGFSSGYDYNIDQMNQLSTSHHISGHEPPNEPPSTTYCATTHPGIGGGAYLAYAATSPSDYHTNQYHQPYALVGGGEDTTQTSNIPYAMQAQDLLYYHQAQLHGTP